MTRFFLPIYRKVCLGLFSLAFLTSGALAQSPVSVIGPITPADCAAFSSQTILKDAGIGCPAGGPLTINPTPGTTNQGLVITQSGVGGSSSFTGVNGSGFAYDLINITSDKIQQTGVSPLTYGLQVYMQPDTGGKGQKSAFSANINRIGAAGDTGHDTIAGTFFAQSFVSNNGTNTGAGANGTLFGLNPGATANAGALNLFTVSGGEVDVGILTGASSRYRLGWSIVDNGNLQAADPVYDTAFEIGASGGPGWKNGLLFSNLHGAAPFSTGACAICTDGSADTIAKGIDLSPYTITTAAFKSPGFQVDGSGNLTANNVTTAWTAFTPSAVCGTATIVTNSARFKTLGKTTFIQFDFSITAIGTCNGSTVPFTFTLPNTAASSGSVPGDETAQSNKSAFTKITAASASASIRLGDGTAWLVNMNPVFSGVYENQ